jgi:hypothetical protein
MSEPKDLLDSGQYLEGADFCTKWLEWRINTMNAELAPAFVGQKSVAAAARAAPPRRRSKSAPGQVGAQVGASDPSGGILRCHRI